MYHNTQKERNEPTWTRGYARNQSQAKENELDHLQIAIDFGFP